MRSRTREKRTANMKLPNLQLFRTSKWGWSLASLPILLASTNLCLLYPVQSLHTKAGTKVPGFGGLLTFDGLF